MTQGLLLKAHMQPKNPGKQREISARDGLTLKPMGEKRAKGNGRCRQFKTQEHGEVKNIKKLLLADRMHTCRLSTVGNLSNGGNHQHTLFRVQWAKEKARRGSGERLQPPYLTPRCGLDGNDDKSDASRYTSKQADQGCFYLTAVTSTLEYGRETWKAHL